jgi:aryl-alcohol dehydrogenase-like predicted oxidoreductase
MAWVSGNPNANIPIIGAARTSHIEVAVEALDLQLDAAERSHLEEPYRPRDEINDQREIRRPRTSASQ